ncbi:BtrH N-terminal domain-containing protein [Paenibacillus donghaensis]|uniref:Butirosin biosynthesis protein H N-terminal domain-containing protein n=1 Tax=Paenibacillus donghaensis TaxID=414771 RepID=A0A2Z2KS78_9BACL|nr:BtrH N-terminal domain-containing protein [Paenibacillus donghaensis]ASA25749.1 hypothetical protein B9T62_36495 [Paenibacillus donghaensis]
MKTNHSQSSIMEVLGNYKTIKSSHCITKSLAEIMLNCSKLIPEKLCNDAMMFGLDSGLDFVYRVLGKDKYPPVFIGGRFCNWIDNFADTTSIRINKKSTNNNAHAWQSLKNSLDSGIPVMLEVDKYCLQYWKQKVGYEDYGGHLVVAVSYDENYVYISDECGKEEKFQKVPLDELSAARNSTLFWKKPNNIWYEFDFPKEIPSIETMIKTSIKKNVERILNPPRIEAQTGINAMRQCAKDLLSWVDWFDFSIYVHKDKIEVPALDYELFKIMKIIHGGNIGGGGNFRFLYANFLKQSADIIQSDRVREASYDFSLSGEKWIKIHDMINRNEVRPLCYEYKQELLESISQVILEIADIEEGALWKLNEKI